jgi:hypothetical protein
MAYELRFFILNIAHIATRLIPRKYSIMRIIRFYIWFIRIWFSKNCASINIKAKLHPLILFSACHDQQQKSKNDDIFVIVFSFHTDDIQCL